VQLNSLPEDNKTEGVPADFIEDTVVIMVHESIDIRKEWSERFWVHHIIDMTTA
jgi:hypothetical protein